MPDIVVVIRAGQIGQAIARRVGVGRHVVLADRKRGERQRCGRLDGKVVDWMERASDQQYGA
jgi:hypothetical protein